MTESEFKAWFEGFSEAVDKQPTPEQWAKIKKRASEIDGKGVTERIYIDRYLPTYIPYYPHYQPYSGSWWLPTLGSTTIAYQQATGVGIGGSALGQYQSGLGQCKNSYPGQHSQLGQLSQAPVNIEDHNASPQQPAGEFNSSSAMYQLGKFEAIQ